MQAQRTRQVPLVLATMLQTRPGGQLKVSTQLSKQVPPMQMPEELQARHSSCVVQLAVHMLKMH